MANSPRFRALRAWVGRLGLFVLALVLVLAGADCGKTRLARSLKTPDQIQHPRVRLRPGRRRAARPP